MDDSPQKTEEETPRNDPFAHRSSGTRRTVRVPEADGVSDAPQPELRAGEVPIGSIRINKAIEEHSVSHSVPLTREDATIERVPANEQDSGQIETLPDGSISIPVVEEEVVITRRTVVRERIIVRKTRTTEEHAIAVQLNRERVDIATTPATAPVPESAPAESAPTQETPAPAEAAPPPAPVADAAPAWSPEPAGDSAPAGNEPTTPAEPGERPPSAT